MIMVSRYIYWHIAQFYTYMIWDERNRIVTLWTPSTNKTIKKLGKSLITGCYFRGEILTTLFSFKTCTNFEQGVITIHTWLAFPSNPLKQLNILWIGWNMSMIFWQYWNMVRNTQPRTHNLFKLLLRPSHMHAINHWYLRLSPRIYAVTQH